MKFSILKNYEELQNVISKEMINMFSHNITSVPYLKMANTSRFVYSAFLDITYCKNQTVTNYSGLEVINSTEKLNQQYRLVVGFVYHYFLGSNKNKHVQIKGIERFYNNIALKGFAKFTPIKTSVESITPDVIACINAVKEIALNQDKLLAYSGWMALSKGGECHNLPFAKFNSVYGKELTLKLHNAVLSFARTQKSSTLSTQIKYLHSILKSFCILFPSNEKLKTSLSFEKLSDSMLLVYNHQLLQAIIAKHCIKSFHIRWRATVTTFNSIFIDRKIVDEPLLEIFTPEFKTSQKVGSVDENYNDAANVFTYNLVTPIPLKYTDNQAKELIFESIKKDIEHVKISSNLAVAKMMRTHEKFNQLAKNGSIKQLLPFNSATGKHDLTGGAPKERVQVGSHNLENVCATFLHFNFNYKASDFMDFLGFKKGSSYVSRLLSLPTPSSLYPFFALLIIEHPSITPSWLLNWKLYDEKGRLYGFKKSGSTWVAVSDKSRKGHKKAEQLVILNSRSVYLIECLISITSLAREYLKAEGSDDYRYMCLSVKTVNSKPQKIIRIMNPCEYMFPEKIKNIYRKPSCSSGKVSRNAKEASDITKYLSLRRLRSSVGVKVYLETHSVHAMAEALGHSVYEPKLLNSYLPKPLWDYFTNRWVRLFQNAIVYHAMKDSDYLFQAVDIKDVDIDIFISNHGLGDIPKHLREGMSKFKQLENETLPALPDETIVTVSVALLQLFIAIVNHVESRLNTFNHSEITKKWFDTAKFVIDSLELDKGLQDTKASLFLIENDVKKMYATAKENPLNFELIKDILICP